MTCVSDGYGALIAATGGKSGILLAVGTGVAAMRLNPDGRCLYASGWGFPGGDLGGGAWIGLQAATALTHHLDGVSDQGEPMSQALAQALLAVTGASAPALMAWLTAGRASDYALLAPIVLIAADSGDPVACRIVDRAAAELCEVAIGLATSDAMPVALGGGLARPILPYLHQAAPHLRWHLSTADPLRGLLLMAQGRAPAERLAPRPGLGRPDYAD